MLGRLVEQPDGWFERGWPAEMSDALSTVVRGLREKHGERHEAWAWGNLRPLTLVNPLGRVPQLAPVFNRGPFAWGGDGNTISQAGTTPLSPAGNPTAIASLRVVDGRRRVGELALRNAGRPVGRPILAALRRHAAALAHAARACR